ncbi:MAG: efflux RND transporter periplasmic adaptor subunit [Ignavibacteria bacterium]|nr:efflux RND transporter periplasmic adaptor subunit [Ignavibacteria bacterium]
MKNISALATALIASLVLLNACGTKQEKKEDAKAPAKKEQVILRKQARAEIQLQTEVISYKAFAAPIIIPAKVVANQDNEALIGTLVAGRVRKVFCKLGDFVKAGQVLMTVEGLDIGEIKSAYWKAKAVLDYTKSNYERQSRLFDEKIGSKKMVLESQAEYQKALAEFKAADKKLHAAGMDDEAVAENTTEEHTSGTLSIKSPISGIVVERNIVLGQLVEPATNAFRVINTSTVWVDGSIYEKDLNKIPAGTTVRFTSAASPGEEFTGQLIYIGQTVDEETRTIKVRASFNNSGNKLRPQIFGEMIIQSAAGSKALVVPTDAIAREAAGPFVFIQLNDSLFEKRDVVTGGTAGNVTEIRQGVKDGERVVINGVFSLKSEMKKESFAEGE